MNDTVNVHQVGVQINFKTWQRFNLEALNNDGVVLFQYLVFHCQNIAQWTHSDNDIRLELGIKRTRLTVLRTQVFSDFLTTSVVKDKYRNDVRAYRIDFAKLATLPVLKQIYRETDANGEAYDLAEYAKIFKAIAGKQPSTQKNKAEQQKQLSVKEFAAELKSIFDNRRVQHNKKQAEQGGRQASGTVNFSTESIRKLQNALKSVGDRAFVRQAFIAFCDALNYSSSDIEHEGFDRLMPSKPHSPLRYFLSFVKGRDDEEARFGVIHSFGEYYAAAYGHS